MQSAACGPGPAGAQGVVSKPVRPLQGRGLWWGTVLRVSPGATHGTSLRGGIAPRATGFSRGPRTRRTAMKPDTKFFLLVMAGMLAAALGVMLLCLLPGFMMDSGTRACFRWLRSTANQEALRECAAALLQEYPQGSASFERGFIPADRVPNLIRQIPPPESSWAVQVIPANGSKAGRVLMLSLGGFQSHGLYVGNTNLVIEGAERIAPGIYVRDSSQRSR